jgi:hypothetical protein
MTNFSDPVVQQNDFGAKDLPSELDSGLWSLDRLMTSCSCSPELLAHSKWDLYVRVFFCVDRSLSCTPIPTSSWEYITSLDFELDIIRGRRSYRWTIWVCSDRRLFACRYPALRFGLTWSFGRSTRLRARPSLLP